MLASSALHGKFSSIKPLPQAVYGRSVSRRRIAPAAVPVRLLRRLKVACSAVEDDGPSDTGGAAAADPEARRMERQQRRAARRRSSDSQSDEDEAADIQSDPAAPQEATAGSIRPAVGSSGGSRIATRRQQRSRALRRVPAPLVADAEVEEDEDDNAADDEPPEGAAQPGHRQAAAAASDDDGYSEEDEAAEFEDDDDNDDDMYLAAGASSSSDDAAGAADEARQTLPASILEAAARAERCGSQRNSSTDAGSSTSSSSAAGTKRRQQQQQQQQRSDPLELPEASPMYIPVLTDEDLAADPPGHKSGYVAVIGRPNAGKSTLINAIVGQKLSIVTFKPQTTRHRVVGIASGADHQMILFDTPGIMQEQRSKLDERMMAAVVSSIKAAEVIIAVVDAGDSPQEALAMFQPGPDWSGPPMAVLLNKADLLNEQQLQQLTDWYKDNCRAEQVFTGSALRGDDAGVVAVKAWAINKLPEGPTLYPKSMVSEQPERFFVSEIIREQIFLQYEQEIPYSCQVQIAEFKERPAAKDYVRALILVERESQAPILLGRGGAAIKQLGASARREIEEFLGRKVYLELSVQVAPAWRQQSDKLKDFGYFDPLYIT